MRPDSVGGLNRRGWLALAAGALYGAGPARLRLGDASVEIVATERGRRNVTFLSLHEDEQTAVAAGRRQIEKGGGRLVEVRAQKRRLIDFRLGGVRYAVDPNRIFSDKGLRDSLANYGPYSAAAHRAVGGLRQAILTAIGKRQPVVALHNNTPGAYSVESYRRGGPLAAEAREVAIEPSRAADDFFLVLDATLFARLKAAGFNVVLQSRRPTDDGSLSVYCQNQRVTYVNVEAGHGRLNEQNLMLDALLTRL